jgi:hypothetical protein
MKENETVGGKLAKEDRERQGVADKMRSLYMGANPGYVARNRASNEWTPIHCINWQQRRMWEADWALPPGLVYRKRSLWQRILVGLHRLWFR